MKPIRLIIKDWGELTFIGEYLGEKKTTNRKYYKDNKGVIYHIRKEFLIAVIEN